MPGLQQLNRKAHPRLPFGRLWYGDAKAVANAVGYGEHFSRSHDARKYNRKMRKFCD